MSKNEFLPLSHNTEWEKEQATKNICSIGARLGWTPDETKLMLEAMGLMPYESGKPTDERSRRGK